MDADSREFYFCVGNRIRDIRMSQRKSVEQLAKEAEISTKYLYQIENGNVHFSILILKKICTALGVQSDTLLSEDCRNTDCVPYHVLNQSFSRKEKEYIKRLLLEHIGELFT